VSTAAARDRRAAPIFDRAVYRGRNTVERCINLLKQNRAVATRYDKRAAIFDGTVLVASIRIWLRDLTRSQNSAYGRSLIEVPMSMVASLALFDTPTPEHAPQPMGEVVESEDHAFLRELYARWNLAAYTWPRLHHVWTVSYRVLLEARNQRFALW
jgi:hypothetical protein